MNWTLLVTRHAQKDLESYPNHDQLRIEAALDAMEADPFTGDITRLHPQGWRRRVGSYRIFYDLYIDERRIVVTGINPSFAVHGHFGLFLTLNRG